MAASIPTTEPSEFVIGERLRWTKNISDYPANEGWTLNYYFRTSSGPGFNVEASADGATHSVDFDTSSLINAAGTYQWQSFVINDDDEKHFITSGETIVRQGFAGTSTTEAVDNRSANQIALDNVRAVLSKTATDNQKEYTIANRQLRRYDMTELLALEKRLTQLVNADKRKEAVRQGQPVLQNIHTRFSKPR